MNHAFLSILDQKLNREMPVWISRRNLVTSPGIDQRQREGHLVTRLGMWGVGLDLHRDCSLDHVRIMSPTPVLLSPARRAGGVRGRQGNLRRPPGRSHAYGNSGR